MDSANFCFHHARGPIYGYISARGLQALVLPVHQTQRVYLLHSAANIVLGRTLEHALEQYFSGVPMDFSDIPLDLEGATAFRRAVWLAARDVPWGALSTYGGLAKRMGRSSGSARAVGQALGANPIAIVIPCHRFVASDGGLGGFGAGLAWKRELLAIEGHTFD